ncbi:MAG TPA: DUF3570 domain-containing protein [Candidatus Saccharimonadia bacterium]|nr:DUF3570 domain-containing protein [Candidatus Saccharimonadia bacterium]
MSATDRNPLAALLAAAAALGAPATRAEIATETRIDYRYTEYDEEPLPAARVLSGSADRYRIDTHQVKIVTPLRDTIELDVRATQEAMSGSSPWFVLPAAGGELRQVMSGATIEDHRRELVVTMRREDAPSDAWSATASVSREDDYRAVSLGVGREQPIDPQLSLSYGASISRDVIEPTDAESMSRVLREDKHTVSAVTSATWVLDRHSTLQAGVQAGFGRGYLDDPYKLAVVGASLVPDARPDNRTQVSYLARYRRAFETASLHLDYRYSHDSWSVRAHTLDLACYLRFGAHWWLVPALRYHSQDEARFYAPVHAADAADAHHSSDYRLGTFGAWSARVSLRRNFGSHAFVIGLERYDSDEGWAVGGADQAVPALLEYDRIFAGFDFAF